MHLQLLSVLAERLAEFRICALLGGPFEQLEMLNVDHPPGGACPLLFALTAVGLPLLFFRQFFYQTCFRHHSNAAAPPPFSAYRSPPFQVSQPSNKK